MSDPAIKSTVYIVDDDALLRRALSRLLTLEGYEVETFASASEFLNRHEPVWRGCVIADLRMPGPSGLDLQAALAHSGNPMPVIFLTGHGNVPSSVRAMKGGAEDFLTKPVQKDELLTTVKRALARDAAMFVQRAHQHELQRHLDLLTPREREVLAHVLAGKLNKEIAADLDTAERTIKAHRASIMEKMRAQSPAELGRIAQEAGITRSDWLQAGIDQYRMAQADSSSTAPKDNSDIRGRGAFSRRARPSK
jgi:FixJ family two-component response regulator